MQAVQQHRQSHKRSTELTVSCLGLSKKQVFLFKFGSFGLVAGARIEAPGHLGNNFLVLRAPDGKLTKIKAVVS